MRDFSLLRKQRLSHREIAALSGSAATVAAPSTRPNLSGALPSNARMAALSAGIHAAERLAALLFCQYRQAMAMTVKPMYIAMTMKQLPEARSIWSCVGEPRPSSG